jgi:hypothetical protein
VQYHVVTHELMMEKKRSAARDEINTQEVTANLAELIDMSRSGLGATEPVDNSRSLASIMG